jgi:hypothetical protein
MKINLILIALAVILGANTQSVCAAPIDSTIPISTDLFNIHYPNTVTLKDLERDLHVYQTETSEEDFVEDEETNKYNAMVNYTYMGTANYVDSLDKYVTWDTALCSSCLSEYDRVSGTPVISLSNTNTDTTYPSIMFDTVTDTFYISVGQGWDSYYGSELEIENQIKSKLANAKDLSDILDVLDPLP